jgi:4,5-DOPA dioxygenase extradiol
MLDQPAEVAAMVDHADFSAAVPTPDHFIPLLYLAGLAGDAAHPAEILVDGYAAGSLSMTAYTLGISCGDGTTNAGSAAGLPEDVDLESVNV